MYIYISYVCLTNILDMKKQELSHQHRNTECCYSLSDIALDVLAKTIHLKK